VVLRGGTVELPLGNTPSTHILKPEPERFPGLVVNETLCMTLARKVGLNVPPVSTRLIADRPCILVQRYDRDTRPDSTVLRVHQEDFCQAIGIPPEQKYQQEGGPLLRDCVALPREWSTIPALDLPAFLDGVIFNVLIGNADAHGKNYSILYRQNQRRLAPLYDLVCTLAWPELSKTPAMKIGKSDSIETITPDHWQKMAAETHASWPLLRERIQYLSMRTMDALANDDLRAAANDTATFEKVRSLIGERASWFHRTVRRKPVS
jgi:serine/threonine-protein kinase HipA